MQEEDLDLMTDLMLASGFRDMRAWASGVKLAEAECRHGRIGGDRSPPCGCWPNEGGAVEQPFPLPQTPVEREPEPDPADEVPCQYCGMPAPRRGPHAGRCPDHQDRPSKTRKPARRKAKKRATTKKRTTSRRARVKEPTLAERYDGLTKMISAMLVERQRLDENIAELMRQLNELLPFELVLSREP